MEYPTIPQRISSLLPAAKMATLEAIQKRRQTSFSHLSSASSVEDFLEAKKSAVDAELQLLDTQKLYLNEALDTETISKEQYDNALAEVESSMVPDSKKTEYSFLVKQQKIMIEDLKELQPSSKHFDEAYASLMLEKVGGARANTVRKQKKFNQSAFRNLVMDWYFAERGKGDDREDYCVVTGWHGRKYSAKLDAVVTRTKAAHIVPKSLRGGDLNYLFGVGDVPLSEARNGLPLHGKLEEAFDENAYVIVPTAAPIGKNAVIEWKIVLTRKDLSKWTLFDNTTYGDLNGKILRFNDFPDPKTNLPTKRRPAARYLHPKLATTHPNPQKEGKPTKWVDEVKVKGDIWATPGPYLRKKMLISLARRVSDRFLPDAFYAGTTFENTMDYPTLPKEQEVVHEMSLQEKIENVTVEDDEEDEE